MKQQIFCAGISGRKIFSSLLTVCFTVLVGGCQTVAYTWKDDAHKEITDSIKQSEKQAAEKTGVPAEISEALLPPVSLGGETGPAVSMDPRFDVTVNNAPARKVYMGLVEGTKYSIVVHPDVGGRVSLNLKNVTVPEAIRALRDVYGYAYRRDGDRFHILPRGIQTRIYPINYLNVIRKGKSRTRVSSGELTEAGVGGTAGTTLGNVPTRSTKTKNISHSMEVETDSKTDFWKEVKESLATIIGDKDGRKVVVNKQAGVAIVRATAEELLLVEDFLGITHDTINRQVVLEAKIIEVELNDRYQTGINWSQLGSADKVAGSQLGGGSAFGESDIRTTPNPFIVDPVTGNFTSLGDPLTSAFGGVFTLAVQSTNFTAFIELLKTQGNVHVLSSPRVSTVNNQKAVIKVGGDEFFVTGVGATTVASTNPLTDSFVPTVELTPFFSGISLDVTPQIDGKENIILHIHPAISEVVQRNKQFEVFDTQFNLPLAVSKIRESDNVVRARSGSVVVIGGLMKEGATDDDAGVPLLMDIPIVGNLFKHKRVTRIKSELVILLKPTVVRLDDDWSGMIKNSRERIEKLNRRSW